MPQTRTIVILALLMIPGFGWAQGIQGTRKSPAGWPAVIERSNRDALSYTQEVIARIHQANEAEVHVGQLARQKGASPEVRRYGRLLAADDAQADRQLATYASRKRGIRLVEPTVVMEGERNLIAQHVAAVAELETLSGEEFDAALLGMMVVDHKSMIQLVVNARDTVDDPDLRTMFRKTLPILRQHLWISQVLLGSPEPVN